MLTDTHAHLYWDSFKEDFDEMIQRALDAGVTTLINVGVDVEKSKEAAEQVQSTNWPDDLRVYSTIGIHPHEYVKYPSAPDVSIQKDIDKLREIYQNTSEKVVAVGECGLDFLFPSPVIPSASEESVDSGQARMTSRDSSAPPQNDRMNIEKIKQLQRKLFQAQIDLAKDLKLPLIVHCRDDRSKNPENSEAWNEVLKMVGAHPAILHCYSGLPSTTNLVLTPRSGASRSTNLYVSFAATITYPKNDFLREAAKIIPLNRILLETDCPFLPPQSKRGQRNEPANVVEIAQTVAEVKGITLEEVAKQTTQNAKQLLNL